MAILTGINLLLIPIMAAMIMVKSHLAEDVTMSILTLCGFFLLQLRVVLKFQALRAKKYDVQYLNSRLTPQSERHANSWQTAEINVCLGRRYYGSFGAKGMTITDLFYSYIAIYLAQSITLIRLLGHVHCYRQDIQACTI